MLDFLREYSVPMISLFLIVWSIWSMVKDKKEGKLIAKKAIMAAAIGVVLMAVVAYMIILK